jgi:hypothetical protein
LRRPCGVTCQKVTFYLVADSLKRVMAEFLLAANILLREIQGKGGMTRAYS